MKKYMILAILFLVLGTQWACVNVLLLLGLVHLNENILLAFGEPNS